MNYRELLKQLIGANDDERKEILERVLQDQPDRKPWLLEHLGQLKSQVEMSGVHGSHTDADPSLANTIDSRDAASPPSAAPDVSPATILAGSAEWNEMKRMSLGGLGEGAVISGRYKLTRKIGEGGMGSVWIAEQSEPVKRQVALKLIKGGRESAPIVKRFEAERQALAIMDHPGIARVYDGGTTADGQPYFVMELVDGIPLTDYCDRERLPVRERLELFTRVCQAVQHAHQKGIIHRDLKPGNVLVTVVDGRPVPKVIDFGLAKAIEHRLIDESIGDAGAIVGTPVYMSPEQADPTTDVDTRADVYALGVILYELLVGVPPLDASKFQRGAFLEMLRMVREVDPPRPSTRLSSLDNLPNLAASRAVEPAELLRWVRGDIDWIVMKALEKERDRRYDSAANLAVDIQRFLTHEPIQARPPSRSYRFRKFVRRNRLAVVATSLVLLAMVGGMIGTTWGLFEARKQQQRAQEAAVREKERAEGERTAKLAAESSALEAARSAAAEKAANELTQKRLKQIEAGNELVFDIFKDFNIRKVKEDGKPVEAVLAQRLIDAGQKIDDDTVGDPVTVATLLHQLGTSLLSLGFPTDAKPMLERAHDIRLHELGSDAQETIASQVNLAEALDGIGHLSEAFELKTEAVNHLREVFGPEDPNTLMAIANLAVSHARMERHDLALPLLKEVLELRQRVLGPEHFDTMTSMNNLASALSSIGDLKGAEAMYSDLVELMEIHLGDNHHDTLLATSNLATVYVDQQRHEDGLALLKGTAERATQHLGPDHPTVLLLKGNWGVLQVKTGKRAAGLKILRETYEQSLSKFGAVHPSTLLAGGKLAGVYVAAEDYKSALPLLESLLAGSESLYGAEHPDTIGQKSRLAVTINGLGDHARAVEILEAVMKYRVERYGEENPATLITLGDLARAYADGNEYGKSIALYEKQLATNRKVHGDRHRETMTAINNLAIVYRSTGQADKAIPLLEETLLITREALGEFSPQSLGMTHNLAVACLTSGQKEKGIELFEEFRNGRGQTEAVSDHQYAGLLTVFSRRLFMIGDYKAPEAWLRESLAIRSANGVDDWSTSATEALLGRCLLESEKYEEAEKFLLSGYEGLKAKQNQIPQDDQVLITNTVKTLIALYQATGNQVELEKWRDVADE